MIGPDHGLFQAGVHQVLLARAVGHSLDLVGGEPPARHPLHRLQQPAVGALLESLLHSPEAHVPQILDPLEVGYCDTARVDEGVGYDHDVAPAEDLVGLRGGGPVGRLDHHLRLDPGRVLLRDLALQRGGNENVALELEGLLPARQPGGPGEIGHAASLAPVGHHLLDVEPLGVGDGALRFRQPHQHRPPFLEETGGVVAHVAQSLDHHPLP